MTGDKPASNAVIFTVVKCQVHFQFVEQSAIIMVRNVSLSGDCKTGVIIRERVTKKSTYKQSDSVVEFSII